MDDDKAKQQEDIKDKTADNSNTGNTPQEINLIDEANKAAERMEHANIEHLKLLEREEAIEARRRLAGKTEAPAEKPKEETPKEYKERLEREIREGKFLK